VSPSNSDGQTRTAEREKESENRSRPKWTNFEKNPGKGRKKNGTNQSLSSACPWVHGKTDEGRWRENGETKKKPKPEKFGEGQERMGFIKPCKIEIGRKL